MTHLIEIWLSIQLDGCRTRLHYNKQSHIPICGNDHLQTISINSIAIKLYCENTLDHIAIKHLRFSLTSFEVDVVSFSANKRHAWKLLLGIVSISILSLSAVFHTS